MIFVFLQTRCNVLKWRSVSLRALWFGKRGEKQAHATVLDVMYGTTQGKQSRLLCVHKVPPEGLRREGRGNIPARLEINNNPQISDTTIDSNNSTQFFGHFEPLPFVLIKGLCTWYVSSIGGGTLEVHHISPCSYLKRPLLMKRIKDNLVVCVEPICPPPSLSSYLKDGLWGKLFSCELIHSICWDFTVSLL